MRIPRRIRPVLALALCVVAAAVAGAPGGATEPDAPARPVLPAEWRLPGYDSGTTLYDPVPSSPVAQSYRLRVARTFVPGQFTDESRGDALFAASIDGPPGLRVIGSENVGARERDVARTIAWNPGGDSEAEALCGGRLLAVFRPKPAYDLRFLCWAPNLQYEPIPEASSLVASDLFVLNYPREANLTQPECLKSALRQAAGGESLHVDNIIETVTTDGVVATKTRMDPSYNPSVAVATVLGERTVGLVSFNSGYQVSEALYRELTLPRLRSAGFESPRATTRSYGSFRGILAIDLGSGEALWERRLGTNPLPAACGDLDGDGIEEIVVPVHAPSNGISACGTTDSGCAYVLCLDLDGSEIWRHRTVGPYMSTLTAVGNVRGGDALEVVATSGTPRDVEAGSVTVFDGAGTVLAQSLIVGSAAGLVLADLDRDGLQEIITGDTRGRLVVYDGELGVVRATVATDHPGYERSRLRPVAANDIDGDGDIEIVALSIGWTQRAWSPVLRGPGLKMDPVSYVVILNEELEEEARAPFCAESVRGRGPGPLNCVVADVNGDGVNDVVLGMGDDEWYVFEIVEQEVAP